MILVEMKINDWNNLCIGYTPYKDSKMHWVWAYAFITKLIDYCLIIYELMPVDDLLDSSEYNLMTFKLWVKKWLIDWVTYQKANLKHIYTDCFTT